MQNPNLRSKKPKNYSRGEKNRKTEIYRNFLICLLFDLFNLNVGLNRHAVRDTGTHRQAGRDTGRQAHRDRQAGRQAARHVTDRQAGRQTNTGGPAHKSAKVRGMRVMYTSLVK